MLKEWRLRGCSLRSRGCRWRLRGCSLGLISGGGGCLEVEVEGV